MISAKTPTAAKIAPMMVLVGFVSLVVDAGAAGGVGEVRKVNLRPEARQHACIDRKSSSSQYRHQSQTLY